MSSNSNDTAEGVKGIFLLMKWVAYLAALPYGLLRWAMGRFLVWVLPTRAIIKAISLPGAVKVLAHAINFVLIMHFYYIGVLFWNVIVAYYESSVARMKVAMNMLTSDWFTGAYDLFTGTPVYRIPYIEPLGVPIDMPLTFPVIVALHILTTTYLRAYKQPEVQQDLAGRRAESEVNTTIRLGFPAKQGWATFENSLFVFNEGTPEEWSTEVDNIIVGQRGVYLIEAKFKSGTIQADPDASQWTVTNNERTTTMRNALDQVRNQCAALRSNLDIGRVHVIPIVAIYGNNLEIHGPSNVVPSKQLTEVVLAFEHELGAHNAIDFPAVVQGIRDARSRDKSAMRRHIERAQAKRQQEAREDLVLKAVL